MANQVVDNGMIQEAHDSLLLATSKLDDLMRQGSAEVTDAAIDLLVKKKNYEDLSSRHSNKVAPLDNVVIRTVAGAKGHLAPWPVNP